MRFFGYLFMLLCFFFNLEAVTGYIVDNGDENIKIFDTNTNATTGLVTDNVGMISPFSIKINQAGSKAYVTSFTQNLLYILNTQTNTITGLVNDPNGFLDSPIIDLDFSPSGNIAVATAQNPQFFYIINALTNTVIRRIATGSTPEDEGALVTVVSDSKAFFASVGIVSFDLNTETAQLVNIPGNAFGIIRNSDGSKVFSPDPILNRIYVINSQTNQIVQTISNLNSPFTSAVSSNDQLVITRSLIEVGNDKYGVFGNVQISNIGNGLVSTVEIPAPYNLNASSAVLSTSSTTTTGYICGFYAEGAPLEPPPIGFVGIFDLSSATFTGVLDTSAPGTSLNEPSSIGIIPSFTLFQGFRAFFPSKFQKGTGAW